MRRLLFLGDRVDHDALLGARRSTRLALIVSGVRCLITYVLVPVLVPLLGLVESVGTPISIALSIVGLVAAVSGLRRFWMADHRLRWAYTAFIAVVVVLLVFGLWSDVASILDQAPA